MTNPDYHALCANLTAALIDWQCETGDDRYADLINCARALLDQPTPQPVAVGERLPGPEDCLDEGWAWFFNKRIGWRQAVLPVSPGYTHWLPANALPMAIECQRIRAELLAIAAELEAIDD